MGGPACLQRRLGKLQDHPPRAQGSDVYSLPQGPGQGRATLGFPVDRSPPLMARVQGDFLSAWPGAQDPSPPAASSAVTGSALR